MSSKPLSAQDLLRKINFLEAEIEIQRQILISIPSDQKDEIEKTIIVIANRKKEIEQLREEIKKVDPDEYNRILVFEQASMKLLEFSKAKQFKSLVNKIPGSDCYLSLKDNTTIDCLIKACDVDGDWTIITEEGEVKQFKGDKVKEKPPEDDSSLL